MTERVASIGPDSVVGSGGHVAEVDVVILATGFETHKLLSPIDIRGRSGVSIKDYWGPDNAHSRTIWTHQGMDNWYRNDAGRVVSTLPWRIVDYWNMTRHADLDDFDVESARR